MQKFRRKKTAGNVVKKILLTSLFVLTVVSDQVSKYFIVKFFGLSDSLMLIQDVLFLRYVRNPGIAFGMTPGNPLVMLILTLAVVCVLAYLFLRGKLFPENNFAQTAMVLLLGGAAGNLIDRIRMREVVDFIDMGIGSLRWPVYNLADIFVTFGMIMLVIILLKNPDSEKKKPDSEKIETVPVNN
jgi:signal peptidase II